MQKACRGKAISGLLSLFLFIHLWSLFFSLEWRNKIQRHHFQTITLSEELIQNRSFVNWLTNYFTIVTRGPWLVWDLADIQVQKQQDCATSFNTIIIFIDRLFIFLFHPSHLISLRLSLLSSPCVSVLSHRFMDQWSVGGKVTFLRLTNLRACCIEHCLVQTLKMLLRHYVAYFFHTRSRTDHRTQ